MLCSWNFYKKSGQFQVVFWGLPRFSSIRRWELYHCNIWMSILSQQLIWKIVFNVKIKPYYPLVTFKVNIATQISGHSLLLLSSVPVKILCMYTFWLSLHLQTCWVQVRPIQMKLNHVHIQYCWISFSVRLSYKPPNT